MIFLNPAWLWLFALLPLIAAMYFLKVKPERIMTPVMFLWDKIFLKKKSSALFRKLKDILSLLLILIAASFVIMALAKPTLTTRLQERLLIIVIDNSASMNALDGTQTRLDSAKRAAARMVNDLHSGQSAVIAAMADNLTVMASRTSNKRRLLQGIKSVTPTFFPLGSNFPASLSEIRKQFKNSKVILVSDCSFKTDPPQDISTVKVGQKIKNIGIAALDLATVPELGSLKVFCKLASSFDKPIKTDLTVSFDSEKNIKKVYPLTVKPGVNKPVIFEINNSQPGKWIFNLDMKDSFDADNKAFAVMHPPIQIKVKLEANENSPFYRSCVESFKNSKKGLLLVDSGEGIAFVEGSEKKQKATGAFIIFNPSGKSDFWKDILPEKKSAALPEVAVPDHPSVKFCNMDNIDFSSAKNIIPPENAVIIVKSVNGIPLLYKTEFSGKKAYVINIDPSESDFFLDVSFPVLLYSMALDLSGHLKEDQPVYASAELNAWKEKPIELTPDKLRRTFCGRPGFYKAAHCDKIYSCSLLSEEETLSVRRELKSSILNAKGIIPLCDIFASSALCSEES